MYKSLDTKWQIHETSGYPGTSNHPQVTIGGYSGKDGTNVEGRFGIFHHFKMGWTVVVTAPLPFCLASEKDHLAEPQLKKPRFFCLPKLIFIKSCPANSIVKEKTSVNNGIFCCFLKTCADFDPLSDMETFSRCSQECILCIWCLLSKLTSFFRKMYWTSDQYCIARTPTSSSFKNKPKHDHEIVSHLFCYYRMTKFHTSSSWCEQFRERWTELPQVWISTS